MLILSPADRSALWHQTVTSASEERESMLRVLAKEIQGLLASELDLYSGWDEAMEATLRTLDASGLIGRDVLRQGFEVVGTGEEEGGIPAREFALTLAGALEESASFERLDADSRRYAVELATMWREVAASEDTAQSPPRLLSVADVAAHFAVTPQAVYKWCEAGKIEFERTPGGSYRIPSDQFDWKRGRDTEAARHEIAARLLSPRGGTEPASEEDMAEAMRQARRG